MTRVTWTAVAVCLLVTGVAAQRRPAPAPHPDLSGVWDLNRAQSQFPRDIGFGMDLVSAGRSSDELGALVPNNVSEEAARNSRQLVEEVKLPPARLVIRQAAAAIGIAGDHWRERNLRPDGVDDTQTFDAGPVATQTRWEGAKLVVRYRVGPGREIRYSYSLRMQPRQLVVQAELLERGGHDTVVRVYDPGKPGAPVPVPAAATPGRPIPPPMPPVAALPSEREETQRAANPSAPPSTVPPAGPTGVPAASGLVPASPPRVASGPLDQRPNAELIGLTTLGIVIEGVGPEAAACGLHEGPLDAAVAKALTDGGLKVVRNSDEDTYLYVQVFTTALNTGFCFSRYDASIVTNAPATPSYSERPVLAEVHLLHKGGLTGGGAGSHGDQVTRALTQYVSQFVTQIARVNR
jgi:hypothetical protein